MTTPDDPRDRELARLFHEAVGDVDPEDRLTTIALTRRTHVVVRSRLAAVLGVVATTAAVIAGVVVLTQGDDGDRPPVAAQSPTTEAADPSEAASDMPTEATESPSPSESEAAAESSVVPVYYVTDTDKAGPRLVREFHRVQGDPMLEAVRLLSRKPADDSYRTLWPDLDLTSASAGEGVLVAQFAGTGDAERPAGMSEREAELAAQQLVYTLQGVDQSRTPVQVKRGGSDFRILGIATDSPWTAASPLETLNLVNITSPEQGAVVTGDSLTVTGVANSPEANVVCALVAGDRRVASATVHRGGLDGGQALPVHRRAPAGRRRHRRRGRALLDRRPERGRGGLRRLPRRQAGQRALTPVSASGRCGRAARRPRRRRPSTCAAPRPRGVRRQHPPARTPSPRRR